MDIIRLQTLNQSISCIIIFSLVDLITYVVGCLCADFVMFEIRIAPRQTVYRSKNIFRSVDSDVEPFLSVSIKMTGFHGLRDPCLSPLER